MREALISIDAFGAAIAQTLLAFGIIAAGCFTGFKTWELTERKLLGWIAGLGLFAICIVVFGGSINSLRVTECKAAPDFELCMTDDGG